MAYFLDVFVPIWWSNVLAIFFNFKSTEILERKGQRLDTTRMCLYRKSYKMYDAKNELEIITDVVESQFPCSSGSICGIVSHSMLVVYGEINAHVLQIVNSFSKDPWELLYTNLWQQPGGSETNSPKTVTLVSFVLHNCQVSYHPLVTIFFSSRKSCIVLWKDPSFME